MEFAEYGFILKKYRWFIITTMAVVTSLAALYIFTQKPIYKSNCKILMLDVNDKAAIASLVFNNASAGPQGNRDPMLNQIELLKTRPVLEEVRKRCSIINDTGGPAELSSILAMFEYELLKNTNIVNITCKNKNKQKAARILNTLVEVFIEYNQKENRKEITAVVAFLKEQIEQQKERVRSAEQKVIDFKTKSKMVSLDQETRMLVTTLANLESERIGIESELKGLQAQRSDIENRLTTTGIQASPQFTTLTSTREAISNSIIHQGARLREIASHITAQYGAMRNLPPLEMQLTRLMRDEQIMNTIYTNLMTTYEEYRVREASRIANIRMIEPAEPNDIPVWPKKRNSISLAALVGLILGISMALFSESIKDRPKDIEEIKQILQIPSLGSIPALKNEPVLFAKHTISSLPSDAIQLLYVNLKFKHISVTRNTSLMVTSAQPGEGKSIIAANLAITAALMGQRTALIDYDFRNPFEKSLFDRQFQKGIDDYLAGTASFNQITWTPDFAPNLTIFSNKMIMTPAGKQIVLQKTAEFINEVKTLYQLVIFDTTPITLFAEPLDLARYTDAILCVTDRSKCSRTWLKKLRDLLQDKELHCAGVIINNSETELVNKYKPSRKRPVNTIATAELLLQAGNSNFKS
jgi:tyrosine-protein kinase Etk/Wzc